MKEIYRQPSLPLPVSELHVNVLRVHQSHADLTLFAKPFKFLHSCLLNLLSISFDHVRHRVKVKNTIPTCSKSNKKIMKIFVVLWSLVAFANHPHPHPPNDLMSCIFIILYT